MNCQCIKHIKKTVAGRPFANTKIVKNRIASTGHHCISENGQWAAAYGSAEKIVKDMREIYYLADCNKCIHKLACLVEPYAVRVYKSKR